MSPCCLTDNMSWFPGACATSIVWQTPLLKFRTAFHAQAIGCHPLCWDRLDTGSARLPYTFVLLLVPQSAIHKHCTTQGKSERQEQYAANIW